MRNLRLIEKIHAIKCCEAKNKEEAYNSFVKITELKNEILSGINDVILNSKVSDWRKEDPKVSDSLFWAYENLGKIR